ncbi:MAG: outer membrane beta-barrel protein [Chthoniobacterales bacterium]
MRFLRHLPKLVLATLLATAATQAQESPADVVEGVPPTPQDFEEPVPSTSGTNPAGFRFSYPVRDEESNVVYTEEKPPAPAVSADQGDVRSPSMTAESTGTTTAARKPARASASSNPPMLGEVATPTGVQPANIDIGEGRFERSPFRWTFGISEGYNSNVNTSSTAPIKSVYTAINAGATYAFGGPRLTLQTGLAANLTYYYSAPPSNNWLPNLTWNFAANYKASERMSFSLTTMTSYLSQSASNLSGAPTSDVGEYFYSDSMLSMEYKWAPKFSTITSYNPLFVIYMQDAQQSQVGRVEQTIGQQFLFLWRPTTNLVAEYRFNSRNYFENTSLDSWGNIFLLGFDHTINPSSQLVFRGGVEQRLNNNPYGGGENFYLGPFGQLSFNYALGANTDLAFYARYGTSASGLGDINQGQQLLLGFSVTRAITARISAKAFLNYQNNYYDQPDANFSSFSDNVYTGGLTISYKINRAWSVNGGYQYNGVTSGNQFQQGDYSQNIAFIGAQVEFGGPKK